MPSRPVVPKLAVALAMAVTACATGNSRGQPAREVSATPAVGWDAAGLDTLVRVGRADQEGRDLLVRAVAMQDTAIVYAAMRADSAGTRWLRTAVARRGWPTRASAGDSAASAAWLVLQHSPDTAWQAAMLPGLERLGQRGEIPLPDLALLTDRILVHRGQPQRYGSQFALADGRLVPASVADLATLDERRTRMGLPSMAEYVKVLAAQTKLPVVWPPER